MPQKSSTWISGSWLLEKALQRRSQSRARLDVVTLYASVSALPAALYGKGRVLARLEWAGVLEGFLSIQSECPSLPHHPGRKKNAIARIKYTPTSMTPSIQ
jgi:hypothetical protein